MSKTFSVIVADPAWAFKDKLQQSDVKRGSADNYPTMTISDIQQLPVKDLIDPNGSILALWVPSSLLQQGLDTMKAWDFAHKQTYVWVKTKKSPFKSIVNTVMSLFKACSDIPTKSRRKWAILKVMEEVNINNILAFGMGRLFRQTHEICLIGTSNNKIYKTLANKSQRSVSFAPNLKHSAKPEHLQDSLEIMFPAANKIELFARRSRPGWICLGNEIDGLDIRDAINQLK
jgi:N6-adenosine-specific RNA methylase IME4